MADIISCEDVGYRQNHIDILAHITWRLMHNQHWAVLGPNGSGKTTLLKLACGYLWPTSGRVLRLGEELIDLGELRRSMGWISSSMIVDIPPTDTALETVVSGRLGQFGLKRFPEYGPTETDFRDARDELVRLGCKSLIEKPFGVLSQGERQQTLIARARMARPLLMVLDEPCAGMDPGVRERFLAWLNERLMQPETPTVVLVTHHIEEIVPGIQNVLVLSEGQVHAVGRPREVVTKSTIEAVYQTGLTRIEQNGGRLWPIWG
ncbi:MAG TPA: ATP-binding cassette domain-containing protein [Lacipirellulaceae bacterium]|jgi:iron complex transport system ATP-binding protein|nr:ATP-binding cassette domain-containing protein [Lacipirellulaceae bacterium]